MNSRCCLGIDTSNYKTSVAIIAEGGEIICNLQQFLEVKKGERGLRQSTALFQHVNRLPELIAEAFRILREKQPEGVIDAVAVSARPRPQEGSYMPVFNAGISAAKMLASALQVPCYTFSHQEGHIEAVRHGSPMEKSRRLLSFHFSGGTTEGLLVEGREISIAGGSRDLAFGQVLDRVGVALGMDFPCGGEMDRLAAAFDGQNQLPKIKCQDGWLNLSGIETKCQRMIGQLPTSTLISMVFQRLAEAITQMTLQLTEKYEIEDVLFAGGVSSSRYIRDYLADSLRNLHICFGDPALSCDNAVGIALLGGKERWH